MWVRGEKGRADHIHRLRCAPMSNHVEPMCSLIWGRPHPPRRQHSQCAVACGACLWAAAGQSDGMRLSSLGDQGHLTGVTRALWGEGCTSPLWVTDGWETHHIWHDASCCLCFTIYIYMYLLGPGMVSCGFHSIVDHAKSFQNNSDHTKSNQNGFERVSAF